MVWLIYWLFVQTVFRVTAWLMGAICALVWPWFSEVGAFFFPWLARFHPIWAEVVALGSDYRVWAAGIASALVGDAVIALVKKRAARRSRVEF
jgi:hypothetical protein